MKTEYNCPICHKNVKDLASHTKRMHESAPENPVPEPEEKLNSESHPKQKAATLTIIKPQSRTSSYHCVDCGAPVEKSQEQCPKCGASLDWSAVNA